MEGKQALQPMRASIRRGELFRAFPGFSAEDCWPLSPGPRREKHRSGPSSVSEAARDKENWARSLEPLAGGNRPGKTDLDLGSLAQARPDSKSSPMLLNYSAAQPKTQTSSSGFGCVRQIANVVDRLR